MQGDRRAPELRGLSLLGVTQIDRVVEAVEETLKGHTVQLLAKKTLPRLDLPKVCDSPCWEGFGGPARGRWDKTTMLEGCGAGGCRASDGAGAAQVAALTLFRRPLVLLQVRRNRYVEILPLSTGCLGACTYCKTKHARGQLGSYALEALVARAREAAADPQVGG